MNWELCHQTAKEEIQKQKDKGDPWVAFLLDMVMGALFCPAVGRFKSSSLVEGLKDLEAIVKTMQNIEGVMEKSITSLKKILGSPGHGLGSALEFKLVFFFFCWTYCGSLFVLTQKISEPLGSHLVTHSMSLNATLWVAPLHTRPALRKGIDKIKIELQNKFRNNPANRFLDALKAEQRPGGDGSWVGNTARFGTVQQV